MIQDYKKLQVWEKSMNLVTAVYTLTKKFPDDEKFGLTSQIRRSAISISSNIAEGKMRGGDLEFKRFLLIAFASGAELETQLLISKNLNYIKDKEYAMIEEMLSEVMKMLNSLITKLGASR